MHTSFELGLVLGSIIGLHAMKKLFPAARRCHMLNPDVNPLLEDSVADLQYWVPYCLLSSHWNIGYWKLVY